MCVNTFQRFSDSIPQIYCFHCCLHFEDTIPVSCPIPSLIPLPLAVILPLFYWTHGDSELVFFLQFTQYISYNTPIRCIQYIIMSFVSFLRSIVSTCMPSEIRIKVNSRIRRLLSCGQIPLQLSQDEKRHALPFLHVKIAPKEILKNSSLMPTCYRKCSSDFRDCAFVGLF